MKLSMIFATLLLGLAPIGAQADNWLLLGAREVTDRVDHDEIVVGGHRHFDHIKICAYRHPVHFYDVNITFENGGHQDVAIRSEIGAGSCSRDIDLDGGQRDIQNIKFVYEASGWGWHRATVRVYAR
jgi:hypothetical protein